MEKGSGELALFSGLQGKPFVWKNKACRRGFAGETARLASGLTSLLDIGLG